MGGAVFSTFPHPPPTTALSSQVVVRVTHDDTYHLLIAITFFPPLFLTTVLININMSSLVLTETSALHQHAPLLVKLLAEWTGDLDDPDLGASFILVALSLRTRGGKWCVGPRKTSSNDILDDHSRKVGNVPNLLHVLKISPKVLQWCNVDCVNNLTLRKMFTHLRLRGMKPHVNSAILGWYEGTRPLVLLDHIPAPTEVLAQQALGKRVATLFLTKHELSSNHISPLAYMDGTFSHSRDALDFFVHDLSHIELFCETLIYEEQVGFFALMRGLDPTECGKPYRFFQKFSNMKELWPQFQYVFSDMNCHSTHLLSYLKAKWLLHDNRRAAAAATATKEETGETETKSTRLGFHEGWPLMLSALGMNSNGDALKGANLLCTGEKMTPEYGEALRDFFRAKGHEVLTQPLSVTEKIRRQVEQIRLQRTKEVAQIAAAVKIARQKTEQEDTLFLQRREKVYNDVVQPFTLSKSFKASHVDRDDYNGPFRKSLNYGEIQFSTMGNALHCIHRRNGGIPPNSQLVDLGSGAGKSCVAAALAFPTLAKVVGIELLRELYEVSIAVLSAYHEKRPSKDQAIVSTVHGDLTKIPWWNESNIIFCNTLVFEDDLLCSLAKLLEQIKPGSFLIHSGRLNHGQRLEKHFDLLENQVDEYSWGKSSVWIHVKR